MIAKNFLNYLLKVDPNKRPTAQECLNHKWISALGIREKRKAFAQSASDVFPYEESPSKTESIDLLPGIKDELLEEKKEFVGNQGKNSNSSGVSSGVNSSASSVHSK